MKFKDYRTILRIFGNAFPGEEIDAPEKLEL